MAISRPIAETITMMLRIIASAPPHTGTRITVRPDVEVTPSEVNSTTVERDVTFFAAPDTGDGKQAVMVREPQFDDPKYVGVEVVFIYDGHVDSQKNFNGTEIADIGTEVFKWLAAPKQ